MISQFVTILKCCDQGGDKVSKNAVTKVVTRCLRRTNDTMFAVFKAVPLFC